MPDEKQEEAKESLALLEKRPWGVPVKNTHLPNRYHRRKGESETLYPMRGETC